MKRRIHQNVWGNWSGYEGARRTQEFGTDEAEAREWLAGRAQEKPLGSQVIKILKPPYQR